MAVLNNANTTFTGSTGTAIYKSPTATAAARATSTTTVSHTLAGPGGQIRVRVPQS